MTLELGRGKSKVDMRSADRANRKCMFWNIYRDESKDESLYWVVTYGEDNSAISCKC